MDKTFNYLKWIFLMFVVIIFSLFILGEFVLPKEMIDDSYVHKEHEELMNEYIDILQKIKRVISNP